MTVERKRVFKFYKNLPESPLDIGQLRSDLAAIVRSSKFTPNLFPDLEHNSDGLLNECFNIDFDFGEEFYILRNALSDKSVETLYSNCLLDWPSDPLTKSNLSLSPEEKLQWVGNFSKWNFSDQCALENLRWITLGYHYDWTNKIYPENCFSPFPSDAGALFKLLANVVFCHLCNLSVPHLITNVKMYKEFIPEASIVNYYRKKTNMGFHIDQAEMSKKSPLVSISLGRPAIFLLEASRRITGVRFLHDSMSKDDEDTASIVPIVLDHGDVMITGGASRLAYHAVPKLLSWNDSVRLPEKLSSNLVKRLLNQSQCLENISNCLEMVPSVEEYVYTTRINMNVRQMYDIPNQSDLQT